MADESAQAPPRRRRADNRPTLQGLAIRLGVVERLVEGEIADGKGIQERLLAVELGQKQMGSELHGFIADNKAAMARQDDVLATMVAGQQDAHGAVDRLANEIQKDRASAATAAPVVKELQRYYDEQKTAAAAAAAKIKQDALEAAEQLRAEAAETATRQWQLQLVVITAVCSLIVGLIGTLIGLISTPGARPTAFLITIAAILVALLFSVFFYVLARRRKRKP